MSKIILYSYRPVIAFNGFTVERTQNAFKVHYIESNTNGFNIIDIDLESVIAYSISDRILIQERKETLDYLINGYAFENKFNPINYKENYEILVDTYYETLVKENNEKWLYLECKSSENNILYTDLHLRHSNIIFFD